MTIRQMRGNITTIIFAFVKRITFQMFGNKIDLLVKTLIKNIGTLSFGTYFVH